MMSLDLMPSALLSLVLPSVA